MRLSRLLAMRAIKTGGAWLALSFVCLVSLTTNAEELPDLVPFDAHYTAFKWGSDVGGASMKLEPLADDQYSLTYSSDVSKFFLSDKRFEHSIFFVQGQTLVPHEYHYKRTGTGPDSQLDVQFVSKPTPTIKIAEQEDLAWDNELDNQLYRIDISRQLAAGNDAPSYQFLNYRGEKREYGIQVVGKEVLTLPYGKLDTIKVKLVRDNRTRETFAWFAPKLDFNLVRLQQFKDGDEQGDIQLESYNKL